MQIKKIKVSELKKLENSCIDHVNTNLAAPFVVVNLNNEVLFGFKSIQTLEDENGDVECVVLDISDNMKSRQLEFSLMYQGMTTMVAYKNFNTMDCPHESLHGLYLWNTAQFEEHARRSASSQTKEDDLF